MSPRPLPRPDPAQGIFETLLVRDGIPVRLDAHQERLARSARELYGVALPDGLAARVRGLAGAHPDGVRRGRIELDRHGAATVSVTPAPANAPLRLRTFVVPGGLGTHKWRDRRLLDGLAAAAPGELPLLADLDGLVLEAAWASVVLVDLDGTARTPPLDGRILAGVGRAALLESGVLREAPVTLAELRRGARILVVNALRGAVTVAALDGVATGARGAGRVAGPAAEI